MASKIKVGKKGLYNWFREWGDELIHPDDLQEFIDLMPSGKVFKIVDINDTGYITLSYKLRFFRVRPDLFKSLDATIFNYRDKVRVIGTGKVGEIEDVFWHVKNNEPYYFLSVDGKIEKKRVFNSDLESIE